MCVFICMCVCLMTSLSIIIDYLLVIILFSLNLRIATKKNAHPAQKERVRKVFHTSLSISLQREEKPTIHKCAVFFLVQFIFDSFVCACVFLSNSFRLTFQKFLHGENLGIGCRRGWQSIAMFIIQWNSGWSSSSSCSHSGSVLLSIH